MKAQRAALIVAALVAAAGAYLSGRGSQRAEGERGGGSLGAEDRVGGWLSSTLLGSGDAKSTIRGQVRSSGRLVDGAKVVATPASHRSALHRNCGCAHHEAAPLLDCSCPESANALIVLARAAAVSAVEATTDSAGVFELTGLESGAYDLLAKDERSGVALLRGIEAGAQDVELALVPARRFQGIVQDEDDVPLANVEVLIAHLKEAFVFDTSTAEDGRFELGVVPEGEYRLIASDGAHLTHIQTYGLDEPSLRIVLREPRTLSGRVIRASRPIPGADVRARMADLLLRTTTDLDGRFELSGLRNAMYEVTAVQGGEAGVVSARLWDRKPRPIEIVLGPVGVVEGTVRDPAGAPVPAATIEALRGTQDVGLDMITTVARTDPDGRYRLELPSGIWRIGATQVGFRPSAKNVILAAHGQTTNLDFDLGIASFVSGVVVGPDERPVSGVLVSCGNMTLRKSMSTDPKGAFTLDVGPGPFELRTAHARYLDFSMPVTAPAAGLRIQLKTGLRVEGVVLDAAGRTVAGAVVMSEIEPEQKAVAMLLPTPRNERRTMSLSDGRFELTGIDPGRKRLTAHVRQNRAWLLAELRVVVEEATILDVVLQFSEGSEISGVVVDDRDRPVADALVYATRPSVSPIPMPQRHPHLDAFGPPREDYLETLTGDDGRFVLGPATGSEYEVRADEMAFVRGAHPLLAKPGDQGVRLVVQRWPRVRGRVVDEVGEPITRFSIGMRTVDSEDGRFEIALLSRSKGPLQIFAPGHATEERQVDYSNDAMNDLGEIVLGSGRSVRGQVIDAESGTPVAGARVLIRQLDSDVSIKRFPTSIEPETITDREGSFSLTNWATRDAKVGVFHERYPTHLFIIRGDDDRPILRLPRPLLLGKVLDATGRGIATTVRAFSRNPMIFEVAETDAQGAFFLPVPPGTYQLGVDPILGIASLEVTVPAKGQLEVELRAPPGL